MMNDELWKNSACTIVDALHSKTIKPTDVLHALESRCASINEKINALPTLCFDRAYEAALKIETKAEAKISHDSNYPFYGLPIPIKDSYKVAGVRTTFGSLAFEHYIPDCSDLIVQTIENAGGIIFAKSNTPEFEAGASTFNEVFGFTRNPWNTLHSAGGSSGGAAASVASGMAFIAQGSDFACSLRYPASFCGVVGLRPTPGLIPQGPGKLSYQALSVLGPIARTVDDIGLAMDGFCDFNPRDPLSSPIKYPPNVFRRAAESPAAPKSFAYSPDLGQAVVTKEVKEIVNNAVNKLSSHSLNMAVEHPALDECHEAFNTLRAFQFATVWGDVMIANKDMLKPEVIWNIEKGLKLDSDTLANAEHMRSELRLKMIEFLEQHNFLITPTTPVAPPKVEERFVKSIEGEEMKTYLDWLALGYAVTITGCPTIAIPCGVSKMGLPIGLQIIGRPYDELNLLKFAAWAEHILIEEMACEKNDLISLI